MVGIKEYAANTNNFIKASELNGKKSEEKRVVIMPGAFFKQFKTKDNPPKDYERLILNVQWNGVDKQLAINNISAKELSVDLGYDTDNWVGAVLQMNYVAAGNPYIALSFVSKPGGKPIG